MSKDSLGQFIDQNRDAVAPHILKYSNDNLILGDLMCPTGRRDRDVISIPVPHSLG